MSGSPAKIGSAFGVFVSDGKNGNVVPFLTKGVVELAKDGSNVAGFGTLLYWDDAAKKVTTTVGTNMKIGYATEASGAGATTVKVKLVPTL